MRLTEPVYSIAAVGLTLLIGVAAIPVLAVHKPHRPTTQHSMNLSTSTEAPLQI